ncbi:helix-turn-helix domain-containing protein [bacterium]|nr:helix-turn-helix domain-containing protein [bacterium]
MKRVSQLNLYEILNLEPKATKAEIQLAYSRLWKTYQPDSLAVYSVISKEEREDMLARIETAYNTLIDEMRRREYDRSIGINNFDVAQKPGQSESLFDIVKKVKEEDEDVQEMEKSKEAEDTLDPLSRNFFKSFRLRKGVSLIEISESTNISLAMLSALENGEYNKLPGRAYAVGFLREYARYLGMDFQKAKQNLFTWAKWEGAGL